MTDKLAEEILNKHTSDMKGLLDFGGYSCVAVPYENALKAMQAYHEAKMKEVTNEDIEAFADKFARADSNKSFERGEWLGIKEGVRAMRDGEIKHIEK